MDKHYAIAKLPTPVLNRPDFSEVFHPAGVILDSLGLLKSQEMIAFPNTVFEIIQEYPPYIYEVRLREYPVSYPLYIDGRSLEFSSYPPKERKLKMPAKEDILNHFQALIGKPYVWGGNYSQGIQEFLNWYPPASHTTMSHLDRINRLMEGVDCSGMLYEATQGLTPRNTSWLANYGKGVPIAGLKEEEITKILKPLDMIIWYGHVIYVLNEEYTIESRAHRGCVFITPLLERLYQIRDQEKKRPMNSYKDPEFKENGFIVRRQFS